MTATTKTPSRTFQVTWQGWMNSGSAQVKANSAKAARARARAIGTEAAQFPGRVTCTGCWEVKT